jgi:hypothetical protein
MRNADMSVTCLGEDSDENKILAPKSSAKRLFGRSRFTWDIRCYDLATSGCVPITGIWGGRYEPSRDDTTGNFL